MSKTNKPRNSDMTPNDPRFQLARAHRALNNIERAKLILLDLLSDTGTNGLAHLELAQIYFEDDDMDSAEVHARNAWIQAPQALGVQDIIIDVLLKKESIPALYELFQLKKMSKRAIKVDQNEIICCVIVRNELLRLPYFLEHHRKLGISRFFIVDNDSTDQTLQYLMNQSDVDVWHTTCSFSQLAAGVGSTALICKQYAAENWVLHVDADELFIYKNYEQLRIDTFCENLTKRGLRACGAIMLDMYSKQPIREAHCKPGVPFLEICNYFDKNFYHSRTDMAGVFRNQTVFTGGVRQRVFETERGFFLSKVPLIKKGPDCLSLSGYHSINLPADLIDPCAGCLLHFKFFSDLKKMIGGELNRIDESLSGLEYSSYQRKLEDCPTLTLFSESESISFKHSQQLVELGVIT